MELSFAHKLEIGFVVVMLSLAGFVFFRNSRTAPDLTIASWTMEKPVATDDTKPISPTNPKDPKRSYTRTAFMFYDGTLEIAEYPPDSGYRAIVTFKPDLRRDHYNLYKTGPVDRVQNISDDYKRTLTLAAYSAAERNPMGLLSSARLDTEQRKAERELRQTMLDQVTLVDEGTKTGAFQGDLVDKLLTALNAYRAVDADPTKDPKKAKLAYAVVELGLEYITKAQEAKFAAADTYIKQIDKLLSEDQKAKLGEFGKQVAGRPGRRPVKAG
jgi:hypothetical protein